MIADIWEKPYETATQTLPRAQANGILNGLVYTPKPSYEAFRHMAAVFNGNIQKAQVCFSVERVKDGLDPAEVPNCFSFEKNGAAMHLYYLPSAPTEKCCRESAVSVYLAQSFCDGVLVDLLSGEVFDLPKAEAVNGLFAYRGLPLTNYPMLLIERAAVCIESE